jgi:hypothetical protein
MQTPEEYLAVVCPSMMTVSGYENYITLAETLTSSGFFGTNYGFAVALRAAHLYTLAAKRRGEGGMITQKTEGRLSVTYGGIGNITSELMMTSYGMQLQGLIQSNTVAGTISDTAVYDIYMGG